MEQSAICSEHQQPFTCSSNRWSLSFYRVRIPISNHYGISAILAPPNVTIYLLTYCTIKRILKLLVERQRCNKWRQISVSSSYIVHNHVHLIYSRSSICFLHPHLHHATFIDFCCTLMSATQHGEPTLLAVFSKFSSLINHFQLCTN